MKETIIKMLLDAGFVPDGESVTGAQLFVTQKSYPYPGAVAPESRRPRFLHPSGMKATVGKMTTAFYRVVNHQAEQCGYFQTKDEKGISEFISVLDLPATTEQRKEPDRER